MNDVTGIGSAGLLGGLKEIGIATSILSNVLKLKDLFTNKKPGKDLDEQQKLFDSCNDYIEKTLSGIEVQRKVAYTLENLIYKYGLATGLRKEYDKIYELAEHGEEAATGSDNGKRSNFWQAQRIMIATNRLDEVKKDLLLPIQNGAIPFLKENSEKKLKESVSAFLRNRASLNTCTNSSNPDYSEYKQLLIGVKDSALEIEYLIKEATQGLTVTLGFRNI